MQKIKQASISIIANTVLTLSNTIKPNSPIDDDGMHFIAETPKVPKTKSKNAKHLKIDLVDIEFIESESDKRKNVCWREIDECSKRVEVE